MKQIDLFIGILIGLATCFIGTYLFLELATDYGFAEGITIMRTQGLIGKVITLGAILNLIAFFTLLKLKKEMMARGVILATILLAILTVSL
jgi:hypothetical protein